MTRLICFGDSLTAGFGVRRGYVRYLKKLSSWEVIGRGQNGRPAFMMQSDLADEVLSLMPDYVLLLAGLNDLILYNRTPGQIVEAFESLGKTIEKANVKPIFALNVKPGICIDDKLSSWLPIETVHCKNLQKLNVLTEEMCIQNNWDLIKLNEWVNKKVTDNYCSFFSDGVHPTEEIHEIMAECINSYIRESLGGC
ncbi:MAG: hypothetical protein GXZ11_07075 [Tissierellia bacterium]|nr:hypothetical protein [Tissierellia bacterium]